MTTASIIRPKMPELDSVRGVATLLVVSYHGFFWSNGLVGLSGPVRAFVNATRLGWLGVHLFFVLSGFLITGILVDSRTRAHYYRAFYGRRALRILPAFYGLLCILFVLPSQNRSYVLLSFVYLSNLAPLFGIPATYGMLWSLAVEEHFYIVWPFAARNLANRGLLACALAIVVLVPVLRALSFSQPLRDGVGEFTWLVADGLAIGAVLALAVRRPGFTRLNLTLLSTGASGAGAVLILVGAGHGLLTREKILGATLMLTTANLIFFGVLGLTLLLGTSRWAYLVNRPILQFFGEISYGLYLIHWLIFSSYDFVVKTWWPAAAPFVGHAGLLFLRFLCVGGVATALAFLSRRYFEEPFLRLKKRLGSTG